ncbi:MAG: L,D-transpeptidase family protein [Geobacteraceae bacterium]|nr:L,D-transpeptidase family protein [Geobacteraceae bacterium]
MNLPTRFAPAQLTACFITIAVLAFWPQPLWADNRQVAVSELERLHQFAFARKMTDELKSTDATFAIAEHYFLINDIEQSERFYLLTIQKARIILDALSHTPADSSPSPVSVSSPPEVSDASQQTIPASAVEQSSPGAGTEPSAVSQKLRTPSPELERRHFPDDARSEKLVGTAGAYAVVKGDTIRLIAAKLGVNRRRLIQANKLDEKAYLRIGQKLFYNNRRIVPQRMKNGIVVNIPDRTLYFFRQGKLAVSLPVAVGIAMKSERFDWKTPTGKFKITAKLKNPTWYVPSSIQSEMEEHGKEVITSVPPGDGNPLGKYAIRTSIPGILIHSTTKPGSIHSFASHGCIRVFPDQMKEFFKEVKVNTPGEIIYKPVKLTVTEEGRIFLEVNRDVYHKSSGLAAEVRRLIEKQNLSGQVNWKRVESVVRIKAGIAEDISL